MRNTLYYNIKFSDIFSQLILPNCCFSTSRQLSISASHHPSSAISTVHSKRYLTTYAVSSTLQSMPNWIQDSACKMWPIAECAIEILASTRQVVAHALRLNTMAIAKYMQDRLPMMCTAAICIVYECFMEMSSAHI